MASNLRHNFRNFISRNHTNIGGWSTSKKIIVIESDDWGSIRMPSVAAYNYLLSKGIPVDHSLYCKYDALETAEDINALLDVLDKFRDYKGSHPIFTMNTVVANPDFQKIENSGFKEYYYEPFTETYNKSAGCGQSFKLITQGIENKLLKPQFHGREHVNVSLWLRKLQNNEPIFLEAFKQKMWGLSDDVIKDPAGKIQATFDCKSENELKFLKISIDEGADLFRKLFGFKSKSFIPNNFIWPALLDEDLARNNIIYIQGMKYQISPSNIGKKRNIKRRVTGVHNKSGLIDLVRNCSFEPSESKNTANFETNRCLNEIHNSFFWKKPAIISMHRLNFMGSLSELNRKNNLNELHNLLHRILLKWPEALFLSSDQLGDMIFSDIKSQ